MTSKQDSGHAPAFPTGFQRVKHHLKQRGRATMRGLKGKTFRDWMQVVAVIAIPIVVAILGLAGNVMVNDFSQKQHQSDLRITRDQEQQAALQTYFDRMSDLILNDHLKISKDDEMRYLARTRTLDVLSQLDSSRKGEVMRFLNDTGLIKTGSVIVDLSNADLSRADLEGINLRDADLSNVSFVNANMQFSQLSGTNLSSANLSGANLQFARLHAADLKEANLSVVLGNATNLNGADLSNADLSGANLQFAQMRAANLKEADLSEANQSKDDLSNADLSNANLSGANLSYAKGATKEQLRSAKSLQGTIMPDKSKHP